MTILVRKPFKRLKSPQDYDPGKLDQQFINAQQAIPVTTSPMVIADYTALTSDGLIWCDCTAGAIAVTLPSPDRAHDFTVTIKKVDVSANAVTVMAQVDGTLHPTLPAQWNSLTVWSNGTIYLKTASV